MLFDQCVRCGGSGHNSSKCKRFPFLTPNQDRVPAPSAPAKSK